MLEFAAASGFNLAYDLNAMSMRSNRSDKHGSRRGPVHMHMHGDGNGGGDGENDSLAESVSTWDSANAKLLFEHMLASNQSVWAFQLGNEPGHWLTRHGSPTAAEHAQDFIALRELIHTYFNGSSRRRYISHILSSPLSSLLLSSFLSLLRNPNSPLSSLLFFSSQQQQ